MTVRVVEGREVLDSATGKFFVMSHVCIVFVQDIDSGGG